jgi:hypothetical protein
MPFNKAALDQSVTRLIRENAALPDFSEGYGLWRRAFDAGQGGVFSITVAEGVKFMEDTMNTGTRVREGQ